MSKERKLYEMTPEVYEHMLTKRGPEMLIGGVSTSQFSQMSANDKWRTLGKEMGFVWDTAQPARDKGPRFFWAIPSEEEA